MRSLVMVALVACCMLAQPSRSEAGFELGLSLGGNYSLVVPDTSQSERVGANAELLIGYKLAFVTFDLGTMYDITKRQIQFRPGARLHLGWFYFRLGLPLVVSHDAAADDQFNIGLLAGIGVQISIKKFYISFEASVTPYFIQIDRRGVLLPAEARLGVGYRF